MKRTSLALALVAACFAFTNVTIAASSDNDDFFTHIHTGKAMANVTVTPGRSGPTEISIQLENADEAPLSAKALSVTLSDSRTGVRLPPMPASRVGEDSWHVRIASLASGTWMLGLDIEISDTDGVKVESPIVIK